MKKFFKILTIILACVFGVAIIAGVAGNFYFGDLNVPDWIGKIKDGIDGGKTPDEHTHEYTATVIQATCTAQGYTLHECECGESYKSNYVETVAHHYVCADCGAAEIENDDNNIFELELLAVDNWSDICDWCQYDELVFDYSEPATCTTAEKIHLVCGYCNARDVQDGEPALGHNYKSGKCIRCGYVQGSHTHSYTITVVKATCIAQGYTLHTCSCGDSYKDNYTVMTAHNYVDYVCTVCGAVDPAKPAEHIHDYSETTVQATCTAQGYTLHTCSCGDSYKDNYTVMTAHHFVCSECGAGKDEDSGDNSVNTVAYPWAVDCLPCGVRYGYYL